ncbi:MAG: hypothetical protein FJY56_16295 [Betaproteobacteria bacterium]|nr:hypothetical protein [Betaproteobacteria bacterium]
MSGFAHAQDKAKKGQKDEGGHTAAHIQQDIGNHRAMADAHLTAAKCLEEGKGTKVCHGQLAKDCKGLAIGTLCGMRHKH